MELKKQTTLLQPVCSTNPIVFLDIDIGQEYAGRIIIELRKDVVPLSAENFRGLCTGEYGVGTFGYNLHYKGSRFHKVTRVFVAHAGDVINFDGSSGDSIYGRVFDDENFELKHEAGVISMANYGYPNTNNSQFVITSVPCDNLNGTNVVIGQVLRGLSILNDMEQNVSDDGTPEREIVIKDCGEIPSGEDWGYTDKDETDKLPPYPNDWEHKDDEFSCAEMVEFLQGIRQSGNQYFKEESFYEARRKYRKALRYCQHFRCRYESQDPEREAKNAEVKVLTQFAAINNLNMAAAELRLGEFENARYACTMTLGLDQNSSKAYFRRAQAQVALQLYEEAIEDLKKAQQILPANRQIHKELHRVRQLLADYNHQQMTALKNLFN